MDTFFQKLRDIQKKERTTGTLSEVDDSFYTDASNYLQELLKMVDNNPLSLEAYQLRDAQRITTEICERREFKIVSTAATNVQKAHDLFRGHKKDSELYDVIPYNTTPEEEEFYKKIVQLMGLMLNQANAYVIHSAVIQPFSPNLLDIPEDISRHTEKFHATICFHQCQVP